MVWQYGGIGRRKRHVSSNNIFKKYEGKKMNSFELRLGNFVDTINRSGKVHLPNNYPIKIMSIGLFKCRFILSKQHPAQVKEYNVIDNDDICGIPLTEEWFAILGFKHPGINENTFMIKNAISDGHNFVVETDGTLFYAQVDYTIISYAELKYVHQLQNIYFSVTGKELQTNAV